MEEVWDSDSKLQGFWHCVGWCLSNISPENILKFSSETPLIVFFASKFPSTLHLNSVFHWGFIYMYICCTSFFCQAQIKFLFPLDKNTLSCILIDFKLAKICRRLSWRLSAQRSATCVQNVAYCIHNSSRAETLGQQKYSQFCWRILYLNESFLKAESSGIHQAKWRF